MNLECIIFTLMIVFELFYLMYIIKLTKESYQELKETIKRSDENAKNFRE